MSCIARKLSVLTLLALPMLPACDSPDEFDVGFDDEGLDDEEIDERNFNIDFDIDFDPNIDFKLPKVINIATLPPSQAWVSGRASQIVVLDSTNSSNEVFAFQVDLDTRQVLASRSASARGTDLLRGHPIALRDLSGLQLARIDPAEKDYLIQRDVSIAEFGGNFHIGVPKGPVRGDDPIFQAFQAKVVVLALSAAKGFN